MDRASAASSQAELQSDESGLFELEMDAESSNKLASQLAQRPRSQTEHKIRPTTVKPVIPRKFSSPALLPAYGAKTICAPTVSTGKPLTAELSKPIPPSHRDNVSLID